LASTTVLTLLVGLTGSDGVQKTTWPAPNRAGRPAPNGKGPMHSVPQATTAAFSSATEWPIRSVASTSDVKVVDTYPVPGGPTAWTSADGKTLFVTSRWAKKLSVVDLASRKVVRQVNVGRSPHGVWTLDHAKI
jgi:YVTN family beta-propeller protein